MSKPHLARPVFTFFILFCIFCIFCNSVVRATCTDDEVMTLDDDASQYSTKWNPFEKDYKEWWFFTFSDSSSDVAWCMGYLPSPPNLTTNVPAIGGMFWPFTYCNVPNVGRTCWRNFQANSSNIQLISDNFTESSLSQQNATLSVGPNNRVQVLDGATYIVEGITKDGSLQWNLTYRQIVPAMQEIFELTFVELDWISYMPLATVQGELIYEGRKIPVDGLGYHDHNWGVWPASIFNWIWAQYGDLTQDFALVMGAYNIVPTHDYIGYIFLRINGTKLKIGTLCGDTYSLIPLKFEEWNGHKYSVQNQVEVKGDEWWLEMNYTTISSGVNPGGLGLDLLVFEQISQYNVSLSKYDGNGNWDAVISSSGIGFNEWSDVIIV